MSPDAVRRTYPAVQQMSLKAFGRTTAIKQSTPAARQKYTDVVWNTAPSGKISGAPEPYM